MKISIKKQSDGDWLIIDGDSNTIEFARQGKSCIDIDNDTLDKFKNPDGSVRIQITNHQTVTGDMADKIYDEFENLLSKYLWGIDGAAT